MNPYPFCLVLLDLPSREDLPHEIHGAFADTRPILIFHVHPVQTERGTATKSTP